MKKADCFNAECGPLQLNQISGVLCWCARLQALGLLVLLSGSVALCSESSRPGHQFQLLDFPPSPFDASFVATLPAKPDPLLESTESELKQSLESTNPTVLALANEVKKLRDGLIETQRAVDLRDPMRQIYERYIEVPHDWVMKNHQKKFGEGNAFGQKKEFRDVVKLVDMILYKDLASNTNFTPLFRSVFELMEARMPGFMATNYARNDTLIEFPNKALALKPAATFDAYMTQLDRRYDRLLSKLDQIQQEQNIPVGAIRGWMYGDLYRMLGGQAQMYVELSAPKELQALRQELRRKETQLRAEAHAQK